MGTVYNNDKQFWDDYWKAEDRVNYHFTFSCILDKYLDWSRVHNYMEIGGAPGNIMAYMLHTHGIEVSTVDFCNASILTDNLLNLNVEEYHFYNEDFSQFDTTNHKHKYDLVASWGFIEHFSLDISDSFIQKQKEMVSHGGYLVVELPNIRYFNWVLYRIFNPSLLKTHNLRTMNLRFLKSSILKGGGYRLLYNNYYLTSFIGYNSSNVFFQRHHFMKIVFCWLKSFSKVLHLNNMPNPLFSPYILIIAQKIE